MKRVLLFAVPFALALMLSGSVRADDFTVTVGCQKCAFEKDSGATECGPACKTADGKVLLLKGDAVKELKFKDGGEYIVTGKLSADGKTIEVTEIKKKA
jgi:hypothetical protein